MLVGRIEIECDIGNFAFETAPRKDITEVIVALREYFNIILLEDTEDIPCVAEAFEQLHTQPFSKAIHKNWFFTDLPRRMHIVVYKLPERHLV